MAKKIAVVKENATRKIHVDLMHDQNKKTLCRKPKKTADNLYLQLDNMF